jgi:hypothetical protein
LGAQAIVIKPERMLVSTGSRLSDIGADFADMFDPKSKHEDHDAYLRHVTDLKKQLAERKVQDEQEAKHDQELKDIVEDKASDEHE